MEELQSEQLNLKDQELIVNRELRLIRKSLEATRKDNYFSSYAYVTQEDLLDCFSSNETIILIQNPIGLEMKLCNRLSSEDPEFLDQLEDDQIDFSYKHKIRLRKEDEKVEIKLVARNPSENLFIKDVKELMDQLKLEEETTDDQKVEPVQKFKFRSPPKKNWPAPAILRRTKTVEDLSILGLDSQQQEQLTRKLFTKRKGKRLSKYKRIKDRLTYCRKGEFRGFPGFFCQIS